MYNKFVKKVDKNEQTFYNESGDIMERQILHVDVNNAFLSWTAVEMLKNGSKVDIREIPAIIGGDETKRSGIVLAKSMKAKECGIKTADTIYQARIKCPNIQIFQSDFKIYKKYSEELYNLLLQYTDKIERFSIDECFLDMTEYLMKDTLLNKGKEINRRVKEELGFTVNVGVAHNKLLAKMASDFEKPNRVHTLFPEEVKEKMWPLPVSELFMAGKSSVAILEKLEIRTIGELAQTDPKLLDYQEKMEQSGNLLLSIINNVLDMARIESGKVELDEDYVKIRDIYQGIYKIFQAEAEKKGIHLEMEYEVQHEHVICDETKNREIFLNLISNAVKYTASGGRVTIRITELDCDRKDYMRIRTQVIDTGIGMSEEFLPSLFEAFARERNTTAAKVAGTGLGMPIIKKYVDMMGGTIKAESKLGEGSKFTVIMEYRIADKGYYEQVTDPSPDTEETDRISGKYVLLAEDNDLNAEIAMEILMTEGLVIDRVEDGIQCVHRIEQSPAGTYDLILMDIQMPNMDGYRATEMIRGLSDKNKANIPIIAMTANAFAEDKRKTMEAGMDAHLSKPLNVPELMDTIRKFCAGKQICQ